MLLVRSVLLSLILMIGINSYGRGLANTSVDVDEADMVKHVLVTTGLMPGEYTLVSGGSECMAGDIEVFEVDGGVTVMLGARALVISLGKGAYEEAERECVAKISSKYKKNYIYGQKIENCKSIGEVIYEVTVKLNGNELTYNRKITSKGKKTEFQCKMKKVVQ